MMSDVGKLFLEYLKKQNLVFSCHIRQLEADFAKFLQKRFQENQFDIDSHSFFAIVHELEYCEPPILKVSKNGFIFFKNRYRCFNTL